MILSLAVSNYRSLLDIATPLSALNVVTGPNGSGKSNLYRSLRLLAETANGRIINALAREGGLSSTIWAGPQTLSRDMKAGRVPIQGGPKKETVKLRLGFAGEDFGYAVSLGLPPPSNMTQFSLDPEIKKEVIWAGPFYRPASALVERIGSVVKIRSGRSWEVAAQHLSHFDSIFNQFNDPQAAPEVLTLRDQIRSWRFYDHFRTDQDAPARQAQLGTRTPTLHHDGRDLAAALQTIIEVGDVDALEEGISDAFPGARLEIGVQEDNRFSIKLHQEGLLRPLSGLELSDGTLRYLLWVAALLSPRPPPLMVLNEPETSLHPALLPSLARLMHKASESTQIWVVSHAPDLVDALEDCAECSSIRLHKQLGETVIPDQGLLDAPPWNWPA